MHTFFPDPDVQRLPPEAVRLTHLKATPLVDRKRVHVRLELTPFEKAPEIELRLTSPMGEPCGNSHILEPFNWKMELTMHLRSVSDQAHPAGKYTLKAVVSYPDLGEVASRTTFFTLPMVTA